MSSRAMKILVVDDEPNMRKTITDILRDEGYEVAEAADGLAAVQACAEQAFDVVLMDVRMPGLNGVEAFRRIRQHRVDARVILMSAYGMEDLKQAALDEGAIAFIDKPLNIEQLMRLIGESNSTAILVVEEDASQAEAMAHALRAHHCRVSVAKSAHEAIEMVEQIRYDVIFIDVQLPVMNGLELYLAIRKITPSAVAVMIAGWEEEFERLAREAVSKTAYALVRKPLDLDHLLSLLKRIRTDRASNTIRKPTG